MNVRLAVKSPRLFVCILSAISAVAGSFASDPVASRQAKPAADSMLGKKLGQVRDDNGLKMKLVWCPPGFVPMEQIEYGDEPVTTEDVDDPAPETRRVEKITPVKALLTRGYWLGKYEVTQGQWKQMMATEPWKGKDFTQDGDDFPAIYVNWSDAMEFCRKLTQQERAAGRLPEGWEYTLPTEAQWERACRARTETKFSFGDDESKLGEYAWFSENAGKIGDQYAHRVGQKRPNPWGLHDMYGNVWEWCRDWYSGKLPGGSDPEVTEQTKDRDCRVMRGGFWNSDPVQCRSACRLSYTPEERYGLIGFRAALSTVRQDNPAEAKAPSTNDK